MVEGEEYRVEWACAWNGDRTPSNPATLFHGHEKQPLVDAQNATGHENSTKNA